MRKASISRKTRETEIDLQLELDSHEDSTIDTEIPFFDHMLTLMAFHARMKVSLKARGDLEVDQHHTVEDVGICLGEALKEAMGGRGGIKRYGWAAAPMDGAGCQRKAAPVLDGGSAAGDCERVRSPAGKGVLQGAGQSSRLDATYQAARRGEPASCP